jgi:hypothetical protein
MGTGIVADRTTNCRAKPADCGISLAVPRDGCYKTASHDGCCANHTAPDHFDAVSNRDVSLFALPSDV